jgi:hypothetical protein
MPTAYVFDLTGDGKSLKLKLTKDLFPDTWRDQNPPSCLVVPGGNVDSSQANKLICHTGPDQNEPVITLNGASWGSAVGDSGDAHCDQCDVGCPNDWNWVLSSKG